MKTKRTSNRKVEAFKKERDALFSAFVMDDNIEPILEYCAKYDIPTPSARIALCAGIYKAVQNLNTISPQVKRIAREKVHRSRLSAYSMGCRRLACILFILSLGRYWQIPLGSSQGEFFMLR